MNILDIIDVCNNPDFLKVILFIQKILNIIFIIVPIGLIVMLLIDFAKNVSYSDDGDVKKNNKLIINRIIMAILLFMVPYIVSLVMNILSRIDTSWNTCYNNLNELSINSNN